MAGYIPRTSTSGNNGNVSVSVGREGQVVGINGGGRSGGWFGDTVLNGFQQGSGGKGGGRGLSCETDAIVGESAGRG